MTDRKSSLINQTCPFAVNTDSHIERRKKTVLSIDTGSTMCRSRRLRITWKTLLKNSFPHPSFLGIHIKRVNGFHRQFFLVVNS